MDRYDEFRERCKENAREYLKGLDNDDLRVELRDRDEMHIIADQSVPVYNAEVVNVCLDGTLLNIEPEIEGAETPLQMMCHVLYDEASRFVYEVYEEFEHDEHDEEERFNDFLTEQDSLGTRFEDAEEAYVMFRSARDSIDSSVYEEVFEDFCIDVGWKTGDPDEEE